jgi:hypothetical protein
LRPIIGDSLDRKSGSERAQVMALRFLLSVSMSNVRHLPIQLFLWSAVVVAAAAISIYLGYELVIVPRRVLQDQIREQKETIVKLEQDKQRLETYLKILKHVDRRARVEVLRQDRDQQGNLQTTIRFTETDDAGKPISVSRDLTLPGQEVYFDTLVIKFDDHFIESRDPLKGQALMLFRRIFSSTMRAEDGFIIDAEGQPPEIYAERKAPSTFEKELWRRFWELANDENLAKSHGVRAIHGDAPYIRLEPDRVYEIWLRSTGEVIITPGTRLTSSNTFIEDFGGPGRVRTDDLFHAMEAQANRLRTALPRMKDLVRRQMAHLWT